MRHMNWGKRYKPVDWLRRARPAKAGLGSSLLLPAGFVRNDTIIRY
jgi:hypothetical protein